MKRTFYITVLLLFIGLFQLPFYLSMAHSQTEDEQKKVAPQTSSESKPKLELVKEKVKTFFAKTTSQTSSESKPKLESSNGNIKVFFAKTTTVFIILFIGVIFYLALKIAYKKFHHFVTEKDAIRESDSTLRFKTLLQLAYWLGTIGLFCTLLYMILHEFGVDVAPLLAGLGIAGLAFGFGGQYLIRDIISGIFILFEDQFHVNDVIKIGDLAGLVEKINLRVTVLRDLQGRVIFIPNGEIKSVINYTKKWSRALFDIGVAYKENVDHVMDVIKELGKEIRKDPYFGKLILNDLEMLGVDDFADSQVTIKFMIKTIPIKQWEVAREFRRRLKNKFDELGIEIPFPHQTVYWGTGADNDFMKKFFEQKKV